MKRRLALIGASTLVVGFGVSAPLLGTARAAGKTIPTTTLATAPAAAEATTVTPAFTG